MTAALVDLFCRSFPAPPAAITLDIDDTCDAVHGHQQLSLFNAHYDTRCFLPAHVYHVESGKPVAVLLRPGKTPSGARGPHPRSSTWSCRIRRHWPRTRIVFRGDSHYGRAEAMAWCEDNGVDYIFGLAGNRALHALAYEVADDLKVRRAEAGADRMRMLRRLRLRRPLLEPRTPGRRQARGEHARLRRPLYRHLARSRASPCSTKTSTVPEARPKNLIKMHKGQYLASDRTSCQSPLANQLRLVLHTAAYWLMLALRDAIPRTAPLSPCRVCNPQAAPAQDRRPRHREGHPRPHPLHLGLPRRRSLPPGSQAVSPQQAPERRGAVPPSPSLVRPSYPAPTNSR